MIYTQVSASADGKNVCFMSSGEKIVKSYSKEQADQIKADMFLDRAKPKHTIESDTRLSSASETDTSAFLLQKVGYELHRRPFLRHLLGL